MADHISSCLRNGTRFAKSTTDQGVDASLLWLAVPFGLVTAADPALAATAAAIAATLELEGGTRRYATDQYYGGGAWPLLTAWLGWWGTSAGDLGVAQRCAAWVEHCYDRADRLPEQVGGVHRDPGSYRLWVGRWAHPQLTWRGRTPCTSSCGTNYRGPSPVPLPTRGQQARPWRRLTLAARAAAPNPPKQPSQRTLDHRGSSERKGLK